jgi:hypothetical protein
LATAHQQKAPSPLRFADALQINKEQTPQNMVAADVRRLILKFGMKNQSLVTSAATEIKFMNDILNKSIVLACPP